MYYDFVVFSLNVSEGFDVNRRTPIYIGRTKGAYKVAHTARKGGYSTLNVDYILYATDEQIRDVCDKFIGPKTVVGLSTTFLLVNLPNNRLRIPRGLKILLRYIRQRHNNKIIMGAQYPRKDHADAIRPDAVVAGYTENTLLPELAKFISHGILRKRVDEWDITTCDYKLRKNENIRSDEVLPLETDRGCIFKCSFCNFGHIGKRPGEYVRDMSLVRDELIFNYENFGVTKYIMTSDTFNDDNEKMLHWVDMLSSLPFKIKYGGFMRGDLMSRFRETTSLLVESGLRGAQLGVESFNKQAAMAVQKSWSYKKAWDEIPDMRRSMPDLTIAVGTIAGLPGDTVEDYEKWYQWGKDNDISIRSYPLNITTLMPSDVVTGDLPPLSDMEKDPGKYGYTIPQPYTWVREDGETFENVSKEVERIYANRHKDLPIQFWSAFAMSQTGYHTLDQLQSMKLDQVTNDEGYFRHQRKWLAQYFDSLC